MIQIKTKKELQEILNTEENVFLKFSASWCGPCQTLSNTIHQLEDDMLNIKFVEVDVDDADEDLVTEYQVMSIPKSVMFKNGKNVGTIIGALPKSTLINKFTEILTI